MSYGFDRFYAKKSSHQAPSKANVAQLSAFDRNGKTHASVQPRQHRLVRDSPNYVEGLIGEEKDINSLESQENEFRVVCIVCTILTNG